MKGKREIYKEREDGELNKRVLLYSVYLIVQGCFAEETFTIMLMVDSSITIDSAYKCQD